MINELRPVIESKMTESPSVKSKMPELLSNEPSSTGSKLTPERARGAPSRGLFLAIATDVHFWIPLVVLLGGLLLLDKLR